MGAPPESVAECGRRIDRDTCSSLGNPFRGGQSADIADYVWASLEADHGQCPKREFMGEF